MVASSRRKGVLQMTGNRLPGAPSYPAASISGCEQENCNAMVHLLPRAKASLAPCCCACWASPGGARWPQHKRAPPRSGHRFSRMLRSYGVRIWRHTYHQGWLERPTLWQPLASLSSFATGSDIYDSVVKITSMSLRPSFFQPWCGMGRHGEPLTAVALRSLSFHSKSLCNAAPELLIFPLQAA